MTTPNQESTNREQENLNISSLIRECRQKANLTQIELAERMGIRQATISQMENPHYKRHNIDMLRRIAEAMSCQLVVKILSCDEYGNFEQ